MDGSFVKNYLMDELKIDERRLRAFSKVKDYVDSLRNGSIGAVVDEIPYINMLMSKNCGEFEIVSRPFYRGGFGFVSIYSKRLCIFISLGLKCALTLSMLSCRYLRKGLQSFRK